LKLHFLILVKKQERSVCGFFPKVKPQIYLLNNPRLYSLKWTIFRPFSLLKERKDHSKTKKPKRRQYKESNAWALSPAYKYEKKKLTF